MQAVSSFFQTELGFVIVQAIGVIAMTLTILCYQFKKRSHILIMQYTGNALWCAHYLLLGGYTGLALNLMAVARGIIYSLDYKWAKSFIWAGVFSAITIASCFLTYEAWYSILPTVGTVIATIGLRISDENLLRKLVLIAQPPWLAYNLIISSYPGAIATSFTIVSLVVALVRYGGFKRIKNEEMKN